MEKKAQEISKSPIDIRIQFVTEIRDFQDFAGEIADYLENIVPGITDDKIYHNLILYYKTKVNSKPNGKNDELHGFASWLSNKPYL